jgi:hypothetical protein
MADPTTIPPVTGPFYDGTNYIFKVGDKEFSSLDRESARKQAFNYREGLINQSNNSTNNSSSNLSAGKATIKLIDKETRDSIPFANIYLPNTSFGVQTDIDGNASIDLNSYPPGKYIATSVGYKDAEIDILSSGGDFTIELESNAVFSAVTIQEEIPRAIVTGFVVNSKGKELKSISVKISITPSPDYVPLESTYVQLPYSDEVSTNRKGEFKLPIDTSLKLISSQITKNISNISFNNINSNQYTSEYLSIDSDLAAISPKTVVEEGVEYRVFDLGRIVLPLPPPPPEPDISQAVPIPKPKLAWDQTLLFKILKFIQDALKKLLPFIIKLLLVFGIEAALAILNRRPVLTKICPKEDKLLDVINKRNKLARQINNIYKFVNLLAKVANALNILTTALNTAFKLFPLIPYPATGVPPVLPPLTQGVISGIESAKEAIKVSLDKFTTGLKGIEFALTYAAGVLAFLLYFLQMLDGLIQECAIDKDIPFEKINNELASFVNQSTGLKNSDVIQSLQQPGVSAANTYKGFTLEIKLDEANLNKYPKRFAQALTTQGVPVLKTESSFASDPQVLLDQLKFIIDSNPQLTAG